MFSPRNEFIFETTVRSEGSLALRGGVELSGHGGELDIRIHEIALVVGAAGGVLTAVWSDAVNGARQRRPVVDVGPATVVDPQEIVHQTRLTEEGVELLGRMQYWVGQALDPIHISGLDLGWHSGEVTGQQESSKRRRG